MGSAGTGSTNGPVPLQDVIVGFGFAEPGRFGPAVLTAPNIAAAAVKPVYAGMVAGYPGLYQVNFKIPKLPSDISRSCNLSVDFYRRFGQCEPHSQHCASSRSGFLL
jgi:uncharacterized protein (TIGR03437 family)